MIDVRVTEDDGVDLVCVDWQWIAIRCVIFVAALHETAFKQERFASDPDQVAGPCNSSGSAKKLNMQFY
jgi:hypothetical protein